MRERCFLGGKNGFMSHNDTHFTRFTQTYRKRLETEQQIILNDRSIQLLCNWDAAAEILHQHCRKADFHFAKTKSVTGPIWTQKQHSGKLEPLVATLS